LSLRLPEELVEGRDIARQLPLQLCLEHFREPRDHLRRQSKADHVPLGRQRDEDLSMGWRRKRFPNIRPSHASAVVLERLACGIRDLVRFPWPDPPELVQLARAVEELFFLGFLDDRAELTELGRAAAALPVDPRAARCLLLAHGLVEEVSTLVALLAEQGNVWGRSDPPGTADLAHARFRSGWGDHLSMLGAFSQWRSAPDRAGFAKENLLNHKFLMKVEQSRAQLVRLARAAGVTEGETPVDRDAALMRALLRGFFMQIGILNLTNGRYTLLDGTEVRVHPRCSLQRRKPDWIVFNACVFTTNEYVRTVGEIRPEWLLEEVPTFFDPARFAEGALRRAFDKLRRGA
jgi:HrpA-like RNA helicase